MDREKKIITTSIIGIVANVILAAFKAVIGLLSRSIAIVMDSVNNLSDALSSIITIIGTKLANRKPDKNHPLGHGRIEYITTMVIAVIILYAGVTSLIESVKKIVEPQTPDYSAVGLMIIAVAVLVKIVLGTYVSKVGKKVNSDALSASGKDALFDSIISASTLVAAFIFIFTGLSLESYLGVIISIVIIKSGIDMLRETLSDILGKRIDSELALRVKAVIVEFPEVRGAYDLVIHDYGPDNLVGSVHVAIPQTMTAKDIDTLGRKITMAVLKETGVIMTGISVYSVDENNKEAMRIEDIIRDIASQHDEVLETHGLYLDEEHNMVSFDMIIDFDIKDREKAYQTVLNEVKEALPEYEVTAVLDVDMTD